jgi:hypothetical protein
MSLEGGVSRTTDDTSNAETMTLAATTTTGTSTYTIGVLNIREDQ